MKKSILIKSLLIAASLPLLAGCLVVRERHPYGGEVILTEPAAPPPPQVEIMPACPGSMAVWFWVPGDWEWRGHWVWLGGHWWPRPHHNAVWVRGGWIRHGHGHVWVSGHWH